MRQLRILHTCDFHGNLNEARAAAIGRLRQEYAPCLLLDCGDALRMGNLNPGWPAEPTLERMSATGYDAMAMGNRETHLWWGLLQGKLNGIRFPILSTNLRNPQVPVEPWLVLPTPLGIRVGVFALTPAMVLHNSFSARFASVVFEEPFGAVKDIVQMLRPQVDFLIALSHLGREADRRIAELTPQIDLILGGHDHSPGLPEGEWVGRVLLARSSPFGRDIGEVTVTFDDVGEHGIVERAARLLELPKV